MIEDRAVEVLTARQFEVWRYHQRGYSLREIAHGLCLSQPTVRDHLDAARRKLAAAAGDDAT